MELEALSVYTTELWETVACMNKINVKNSEQMQYKFFLIRF